MKKFIQIKKASYDKTITLDPRASYQLNIPFEEYVKDAINNGIAYKEIILPNIKTLSHNVVASLTPHYLAGSIITINNVSFQNPHPHFRFKYEWVPFNRLQIPKSLANFKVGSSNFLSELCKTTGNYLPNNLWVALDEYSKERIDKCKTYNKFDYSDAENWYKQLIRCKEFKAYSPNDKTFYEVMAEDTFQKSIPTLEEGLRTLNNDEIRFLQTYAPAYGIEIQTFNYRDNYRKTRHGYTIEPERVVGPVSQGEIERCYYDPRNNNNLPKTTRDGFRVKASESSALLREAYTCLMWFLHQKNSDQFLAEGWHRCPVCHQLYQEYEGCDGHVPPIEIVRADNLLYGISSTYSDIDAEQEYLHDNAEEQYTFEEEYDPA